MIMYKRRTQQRQLVGMLVGMRLCDAHRERARTMLACSMQVMSHLVCIFTYYEVATVHKDEGRAQASCQAGCMGALGNQIVSTVD